MEGETINPRQIFSLTLWKSPLFVIYQFFTLLAVVSCSVSQQYLAANAEDVGFTNVQAAYLLSIIGACDLIGRVAFGLLSHLGWFERYKIFMVSQLAIGTAMIVTPFARAVELLGLLCGVIGLQIGVFYPAIPVTLDDFFGRENLYKSIGINQCIQGIGSLIASSYTGTVIGLSHLFVFTNCSIDVWKVLVIIAHTIIFVIIIFNIIIAIVVSTDIIFAHIILVLLWFSTIYVHVCFEIILASFLCFVFFFNKNLKYDLKSLRLALESLL